MMASTIAEKLGFAGEQNILVESKLGKGSTFHFHIEDKMILEDDYQSYQSDLLIPDEKEHLRIHEIYKSIYNKSRHHGCSEDEFPINSCNCT